MGHGKGGGLGGPVAVDQAQVRQLGLDPPEGRGIRPFAATEQHAQPLEGLGNQLHVLVEQAGGEEQQADPGAFQQRAEGVRVQQCRVVHHHDPATVEQRPPDLQGAGVEGRVGGEGHPVLGVEIGIAVVDHQPGDGPVRHPHALGRSSGTGGVHDVGHRLGRQRQVRVVPGQPVEAQAVQVDPLHRGFQHPLAVAEQHRRPAVGQHEPQALGRGIDVQRYIGGAALAHRQLAHQQVQGARQQQRHVIPRLHPQLQQMLGQLVGPGVELDVAELFGALHRRHLLRPGQHLLLETLVQGLLARVVAHRVVEALQYLPALGLRQHRHLADGLFRLLLQGQQQLFQGAVQVVADAPGIDPGGHGGEHEAVPQVVDAQGQRVVAALLGIEQLHALPGTAGLPRLVCRRGTVAVVEQAG